MATSNRVYRVAQQIQIELMKIIAQEVNDPRLGEFTITDVEVTRDLAHAKVYIVVRDPKEKEMTLTVLNKAAGFMQQCLGKEIKLRIIPKLAFCEDTSADYGNKIDDLLRGI